MRFRRLVRYHELVRELREHSDSKLADLGIATANIERIAYEASGGTS